MSSATNSEQCVIDEDVKTLHSLGYAQELMRRMSGFSNFAISMSIICILAGCVTSFHLAFCGAGGAAVGLGWPLRCVFAQCVAATMAQYLCSLAALTSASRMAYAFARDGGLPQVMRHVSPKFSTPSVAIWVTATIGVAFTLVPKYDTISAACSIFVYIAYVIPAAVGLFAYGRTWTKMGPWDMGGWYRVLAVLSIIGCLVIIAIGVAPPNDLNLWIVGGSLALLAIVWFAFERHRFQGPPTGRAIEERQAQIAESEQRSHVSEHVAHFLE